jgi:hypothetical protein
MSTGNPACAWCGYLYGGLPGPLHSARPQRPRRPSERLPGPSPRPFHAILHQPYASRGRTSVRRMWAPYRVRRLRDEIRCHGGARSHSAWCLSANSIGQVDPVNGRTGIENESQDDDAADWPVWLPETPRFPCDWRPAPRPLGRELAIGLRVEPLWVPNGEGVTTGGLMWALVGRAPGGPLGASDTQLRSFEPSRHTRTYPIPRCGHEARFHGGTRTAPKSKDTNPHNSSARAGCPRRTWWVNPCLYILAFSQGALWTALGGPTRQDRPRKSSA